MFYPNNIPWPKIHEYILEVGNERQPVALFKKALTEIHRLISFDSAQILFIDDVTGKLQLTQKVEQDIKHQPVEFYKTSKNNAFQITHQEVLYIPERYQDSYPFYYKQTDLSVAQLPENPLIFRTNQDIFRNTSFGVDWCKPLDMNYSAGMRFFNPEVGKVVVFLLYRSRCQAAFSDLEIAMFNILQPHLANLVANLQRQAPVSSSKDIESRVKEFRQLTRREIEIIILLCQGYNTHGICSKLFISKETFYRHTNNIYRKLKISNRQELFALVMGTQLLEIKEEK